MKSFGRISGIFRLLIAGAFFLSSLPPAAFSYDMVLPEPGRMMAVSPTSQPPILKGVKVHAENPFLLDFILDSGDKTGNGSSIKEVSLRLVKYFLTALTMPEKDMWVNLSPYEHGRIMNDNFGLTGMGRDLLGQDYLLKQMTASLIYPRNSLGKEFWDRVYARAREKYGTSDVAVDTFNKVWIVPEKALVYEHNGVAYILDVRMKVLLEQDYLAFEANKTGRGIAQGQVVPRDAHGADAISSRAARAVLIPELEREVNEGKNFEGLRQIYNSMVLAAWYKRKIKKSILNKLYVDKAKVKGVHLNDPGEVEGIYQRYVAAFKKGVFNYIAEDMDRYSQEVIPRKYFSGGFDSDMAQALVVVDSATKSGLDGDIPALNGILGNKAGIVVETRLFSFGDRGGRDPVFQEKFARAVDALKGTGVFSDNNSPDTLSDQRVKEVIEQLQSLGYFSGAYHDAVHSFIVALNASGVAQKILDQLPGDVNISGMARLAGTVARVAGLTHDLQPLEENGRVSEAKMIPTLMMIELDMLRTKALDRSPGSYILDRIIGKDLLGVIAGEMGVTVLDAESIIRSMVKLIVIRSEFPFTETMNDDVRNYLGYTTSKEGEFAKPVSPVALFEAELEALVETLRKSTNNEGLKTAVVTFVLNYCYVFFARVDVFSYYGSHDINGALDAVAGLAQEKRNLASLPEGKGLVLEYMRNPLKLLLATAGFLEGYLGEKGMSGFRSFDQGIAAKYGIPLLGTAAVNVDRLYSKGILDNYKRFLGVCGAVKAAVDKEKERQDPGLDDEAVAAVVAGTLRAPIRVVVNGEEEMIRVNEATVRSFVVPSEGGPAGSFDQASAQVNGGIDLDAARLNMQVKNDGSEINFHFDSALWQGRVIEGLYPVILKITPSRDISSMFGVTR